MFCFYEIAEVLKLCIFLALFITFLTLFIFRHVEFALGNHHHHLPLEVI